jgi:hypothetical protein
VIALWDMVAELDRRAEVARRERDWLTSGRLMEARRVLFHVAVTAPDPGAGEVSQQTAVRLTT